MVVAVGETDCVPLVALVPLHPLEAVQLVALVDDHVSVDDCPLVMLVGFADNVAVGAGVGAFTVILIADEVV